MHLLFSPLILPADLILLLRSEIVLNVECLADFFGGLALDHVGDGLAANIQQALDIEVVRGQDNLKQHLLIDLHELLVPLIDVGGLTTRVIVVTGAGGVALVVLAPLNDLPQDSFIDLRSRMLGLFNEW